MKALDDLPTQVRTPVDSAWSQHTSARNGMEYWHNAITDETTWLQPVALTRAVATTQWPGWTQHASKATRRQFWYCSTTGETSWTLPDGALGSAPRVSLREEAVQREYPRLVAAAGDAVKVARASASAAKVRRVEAASSVRRARRAQRGAVAAADDAIAAANASALAAEAHSVGAASTASAAEGRARREAKEKARAERRAEDRLAKRPLPPPPLSVAANALFKEAAELQEKRDYEDAAAKWQALFDFTPALPLVRRKEAAVKAAQCFHLAGFDDEYLGELLNAIDADKSDPALHLEAATALFNSREYGDALEHFEARVALNPDADGLNAETLLKMGLCAYQLMDHDRARGFCRQALTHNPSEVERKTAKKIIRRIEAAGVASKAEKSAYSEARLSAMELMRPGAGGRAAVTDGSRLSNLAELSKRSSVVGGLGAERRAESARRKASVQGIMSGSQSGRAPPAAGRTQAGSATSAATAREGAGAISSQQPAERSRSSFAGLAPHRLGRKASVQGERKASVSRKASVMGRERFGSATPGGRAARMASGGVSTGDGIDPLAEQRIKDLSERLEMATQGTAIEKLAAAEAQLAGKDELIRSLEREKVAIVKEFALRNIRAVEESADRAWYEADVKANEMRALKSASFELHARLRRARRNVARVTQAQRHCPPYREAGTRINGRFKIGTGAAAGEMSWFPGRVVSYDDADDTYDIMFDDGDRQQSFHAEDVALLFDVDGIDDAVEEEEEEVFRAPTLENGLSEFEQWQMFRKMQATLSEPPRRVDESATPPPGIMRRRLSLDATEHNETADMSSPLSVPRLGSLHDARRREADEVPSFRSDPRRGSVHRGYAYAASEKQGDGAAEVPSAAPVLLQPAVSVAAVPTLQSGALPDGQGAVPPRLDAPSPEMRDACALFAMALPQLDELRAKLADVAVDSHVTKQVFVDAALRVFVPLSRGASVQTKAQCAQVLEQIFDHFDAFEAESLGEPHRAGNLLCDYVALGFQSLIKHCDVTALAEELFACYDLHGSKADRLLDENELHEFLACNAVFANALRPNSERCSFEELGTGIDAQVAAVLEEHGTDRALNSDAFAAWLTATRKTAWGEEVQGAVRPMGETAASPGRPTLSRGRDAWPATQQDS